MKPAYDEATLDFYSAEAARYAASGENGASRHLPAFLHRLAPGAKILELGCGGGRDSESMIAQGFVVDPTDGVPAMAEKAAERLGRPVRVLRFDELDACAAYDAIWASACLLYVPRPALPDIFARIERALLPRGLLCASFKAGKRDGRDGFGRYFNFPARSDLQSALGAGADWSALHFSEGEGDGYDGRTWPWITVIASK